MRMQGRGGGKVFILVFIFVYSVEEVGEGETVNPEEEAGGGPGTVIIMSAMLRLYSTINRVEIRNKRDKIMMHVFM